MYWGNKVIICVNNQIKNPLTITYFILNSKNLKVGLQGRIYAVSNLIIAEKSSKVVKFDKSSTL